MILLSRKLCEEIVLPGLGITIKLLKVTSHRA